MLVLEKDSYSLMLFKYKTKRDMWQQVIHNINTPITYTWTDKNIEIDVNNKDILEAKGQIFKSILK